VLPARADIEVVKAADPLLIRPGDEISYTITVTNHGPDPAEAVQLHDQASAGLTITNVGIPCDVSGFPCELGDLAAADQVNVSVTAAVPSDQPAPSLVFNTATASSTTTNDPDPANNRDEVHVQVDGDIPLWHDVVWSYGGDIVTAYFDGTRFETVVEDPSAALDSPVVAPDGYRLGLARRTATGSEACTFDAAGLRCAQVPELSFGLDWAADSLSLYATAGHGAGTIWTVNVATEVPAAEQLLDAEVHQTIGLSVSRDGEQLVMAQDPFDLVTATFVEVYDLPGGTAATIVPDDGYSDQYPQCSPVRDEIVWARGSETTCCDAPSDIWIMDGDGSNQLNLTGTPDINDSFPHYSLEGEHVFSLADSVLSVAERDGANPQQLFDLLEVSNFDITASYPPPVCGEIVDDFDYQGFGPDSCSGDSVRVTSDAELAAYHADLGYDPATGQVKSLVVAYNPTGVVEIHSPCQVELVGEDGIFDIDAESLQVFGKQGVWVAQGYASGTASITTAGALVLASESEHARFFQGMTLEANRICVQAAKKAEIGKDSFVNAASAVELVGTSEIGSSDAIVDQGSHIITGRFRLEAFTQALVAKDTIIEASEVRLLANGDTGAADAVLKQGAEVFADEMWMLSGRNAAIEKNVTVTVTGNFEMDAARRCSIDKKATIVAGSTSGSCFE
jgi:uncharacterized repeat protein (TIGR01451 family)